MILYIYDLVYFLLKIYVMKRLKIVSGVLAIFILSVFLSNCGGSKTDKSKLTLTENPPFSIEEVYSQKWMAGVKEGGSGTNIYISLNNIEPGTLINEVYFRNKITTAEEKNNQIFVGYFKNEQQDIIMDSDATKEANNIPPQKFPFQLEESEAVLSYTYKGIEYYYKISNIEEKELIAYPSNNPNNEN